ncbi:MAG: glycine--tRNA ligase [Nanoarchaeota archaeon]
MAYLVKKTINNHQYYYLKESKREGDKITTKNIAYFGKKKPTKKEVKQKMEELSSKKQEKTEKLFKPSQKSNTMISINDMATFCKKKGFIYQNSEIYGGMAGFFDYGPLGVELKNNIKQAFWKRFVQDREDVVGIDGTIITHPKVWEASGHVDSFTDYIYRCDKCKVLLKGDDDKGLKCPKCNEDLKSRGQFNLMFTTQVGPVEGNISYLRPETAQVIFTDFKLVMDSARQKLPFGIAQIGKAFRNEISPRDFLFRCREFEQFEIEYFVHPDKVKDCPYVKEFEDMEIQILTQKNQENKEEHSVMKIKDLVDNKICSSWHAYWLASYYTFFINMGIRKENLRLREHLKDELAHYASACFDIEYKFPFGWKEIHGNADRGQFDLKQHQEHSKQSMEYFDEETKQKVLPYVASEPSQGIDRAFLSFLYDAYQDDKERGNIVLSLHPGLVPIKAAVFPLINKLEEEAKGVFNKIKKEFTTIYDRSGSVGRRYARADEIGIPYCITVDFDTQKDNSVTIRDRDTTNQIRVKVGELNQTINKLISQEITFKDLK